MRRFFAQCVKPIRIFGYRCITTRQKCTKSLMPMLLRGGTRESPLSRTILRANGESAIALSTVSPFLTIQPPNEHSTGVALSAIASPCWTIIFSCVLRRHCSSMPLVMDTLARNGNSLRIIAHYRRPAHGGNWRILQTTSMSKRFAECVPTGGIMPLRKKKRTCRVWEKTSILPTCCNASNSILWGLPSQKISFDGFSFLVMLSV